MALNPLANPKGVKLCCELCSKPAFISCTKCRVTYYCDEEHQNIDWIGIHEKICHLLPALRMPVPFTSGSEEAREYQHEQKVVREKQLVELTSVASQKLLFEEKYEYAVPAAMQALKFSIAVYGLSSIELVPSYLILGEACIGLGRLEQAEDYLLQGQWTVLKTPECTNEIKARLHRNLGMLHAERGNFSEALTELAECIYQASYAWGENSVKASGGYFHMANIFYQQDKMDVAFSIFDHLVDIWNERLSTLVSQILRVSTPPTGIGPSQYEKPTKNIDYLDDTQGAEASQVLLCIMNIREQQKTTSPAILRKLYHTLAMLAIVLEDYKAALDYSAKCDAMAAKQPGKKTDEEMLGGFPGGLRDTIRRVSINTYQLNKQA